MSTLTELLELTEAVQAAISAGDWQEASRLECHRRMQLSTYLEHARSDDDGFADLRDSLAGLQQRGDQLIGEVQHHRRQLAFEACRLDRGKRAVVAYGAQSSDI